EYRLKFSKRPRHARRGERLQRHFERQTVFHKRSAPTALEVRPKWYLREIDFPRFVVRNKVFSKFVERSRFDPGARPLHEIELEMQVVQCDKPQSENFFCLD